VRLHAGYEELSVHCYHIAIRPFLVQLPGLTVPADLTQRSTITMKKVRGDTVHRSTGIFDIAALYSVYTLTVDWLTALTQDEDAKYGSLVVGSTRWDWLTTRCPHCTHGTHGTRGTPGTHGTHAMSLYSRGHSLYLLTVLAVATVRNCTHLYSLYGLYCTHCTHCTHCAHCTVVTVKWSTLDTLGHHK
jgi:hypothetical protein